MQNNLANPVDIMQLMTGNDLYIYKRKNSKGSFQELIRYDEAMKGVKKGAVFVSPSKEDLTQGKGFVVSSYESLAEKVGELSHWTPNTFRGGSYYDFKNRIIKGHTRDNLKQINVIGFDIDTKEVDLYALFLGCDELGLPRPNLILSTPKGYQGFFILETPFFIHKQQDYKAIRVAERLSENILNALNSFVPVDRNCAPFGFYRIPNGKNVVFFDDAAANTQNLIAWSKQYEKEEQKKAFHVVYGGKDSSESYTASAWYRALLQAKNIQPGEYSASRNNALFTLALANYADGVVFDTAYDVLDQFNSSLSNPLSKSEFERTLKSAYSGKYSGVKREYVEPLLEAWTDGTAKFTGKCKGWYKFAKPREERKRSHAWEWVEDIKAFLESKTSAENPYYEISYRELAKEIGMPLSSLKKALKSNQFHKKTKGKGRAAMSFFATKSTLISHVIQVKKENPMKAQITFMELFHSEEIQGKELPKKSQEHHLKQVNTS